MSKTGHFEQHGNNTNAFTKFPSITLYILFDDIYCLTKKKACDKT